MDRATQLVIVVGLMVLAGILCFAVVPTTNKEMLLIILGAFTGAMVPAGVTAVRKGLTPEPPKQEGATE